MRLQSGWNSFVQCRHFADKWGWTGVLQMQTSKLFAAKT